MRTNILPMTSSYNEELHYNKIIMFDKSNSPGGVENDDKFHLFHKNHPHTILHCLEEIYQALDNTLFHHEKDVLFKDKVMALAEDIIHLTTINKSLMLATIIHNTFNKYTIKHSIDTAILSILVAINVGKTYQELQEMACACLTMNIGMLKEHDEFQLLSSLNEEQKQLVLNHGKTGYAILKDKGITNNNWLNHVLYHNGAVNSVQTINENTHIIMIADRYCALLAKRINREPLRPSEAIHHIITHQKEGVSPLLSVYFIKELGMYQGGSIVKLLNGELGIVVEKGQKKTNPIVYALINKSGEALSLPSLRDTSAPELRVLNTVCSTMLPIHINLEKIWSQHFENK